QGGDLLDGRNFSPIEAASGAYVTVINDKAVESLMPGLDPIGKVIKIFGLPFTVVGLYRDPSGVFGDDSSPKIVIPHGTLAKAGNGERGWMNIAVFPREDVAQSDV